MIVAAERKFDIVQDAFERRAIKGIGLPTVSRAANAVQGLSSPITFIRPIVHQTVRWQLSPRDQRIRRLGANRQRQRCASGNSKRTIGRTEILSKLFDAFDGRVCFDLHANHLEVHTSRPRLIIQQI